MNLDQLREALAGAGFRMQQYRMPDRPWIAYRRFPGARPCESNDDKPGVQIVIEPTEIQVNGSTWVGVSVDLTGEVGGRWFKLSCYSLRAEELLGQLPDVEASLVAAWTALAPAAVESAA